MTDKESSGDFSRLPFRKRIELTKESIQKDLEASDYLFPKNVYINTKYILEIIEQAERVQDLEEIKNDAINQIDVTQRRNERLEKRVQELEEELNKAIEIGYKFEGEVHDLTEQNKRYREALEEIAQRRMTYADMAGAIRIARKALEGEE